MKGLSDSQVEMIRQATEDVLENTGFRVLHPQLPKLLRKAGARVDEASGAVRIPRPLLRELLRQVPNQYTICGVNGQTKTVGGKRRLCLAIVTDPWIIDYHTGKPRRPSLEDVRRHTQIAQGLEQVAAVSLMDYPVTDVHGPHSSLHALEEHLLNYDKHLYVLPTSVERLDTYLRIGRILSPGRELRETRLMTVGVAVVSPLTLTEMNADVLLLACENDFPVVPTVCPMAGTTSPYSKAGTLLLGNAENVFMAALTQLIRPGHPFLYALGPSKTDMRNGEDLYYTLDKIPWKIGSGQLANSYGIPSSAECGGMMGCRYDLQGGAEGMLFMLSAYESGASVLAGIGSCLNAVGMSAEMMVIQTAWLEAAEFLSRGMDTQSHLALENIGQVGPGGHYLTDGKTLELLRSDEFFSCDLFDYESLPRGEPSMLERAHGKVEEITTAFRTPVPGDIREAIRGFFRDAYGR